MATARSKRIYLPAVIALVCLGAMTGRVRADALVVTKAMKASTIAEVFIEPQGVRVELEIAPADMEVFQDLLPQQVYAALGEEKVPLDQRHQRFLRDGIVLRNHQNAQLSGVVERTEIRRRIVRDEITGQPLSTQPPDAELVLRTSLRYDFVDQPSDAHDTAAVANRQRTVGCQHRLRLLPQRTARQRFSVHVWRSDA